MMKTNGTVIDHITDLNLRTVEPGLRRTKIHSLYIIFAPSVYKGYSLPCRFNRNGQFDHLCKWSEMTWITLVLKTSLEKKTKKNLTPQKTEQRVLFPHNNPVTSLFEPPCHWLAVFSKWHWRTCSNPIIFQQQMLLLLPIVNRLI